MIEETYRESLGFLSKDFNQLYIKFAKVTAISLLPIILSIALSLILIFNPVFFVLGLMFLLFIGLFFSIAFQTVFLKIIEKKDESIMINYWKNLIPFLKYSITTLIIHGIASLPLIAIFVYLIINSNQLGDLFLQLIMNIYGSIVFSVLYLFFQFALFEIILSKKGTINGFSSSIRKVKKNLLSSVLFSISLWIVETVATVVFFILIFIIAIIFAGAFLVLSAISNLVWIPIIIIGIILFLVLFFLFSVFISLVSISIKYTFWKKLRD